MAQILGIGIATLDIINQLDSYPIEDSEVRATAQQITRGGNVTNSLVVLSQLGEQCHWCGVLADDPGSLAIRADLERHQIDFQHCAVIKGTVTPTSYIVLNSSNGSRTIVHYRDLPELDLTTFQACPLDQYQWLHFEGRAVNDTLKMMQFARQQHPQLVISLEVEKPREGIEQLFPHADLLLFSRHYATTQGYRSAPELLQAMRAAAPDSTLVCAWGEDGAYAAEANGEIIHSLAVPQSKIVDSLGAGDTFNAGMIHNLLAKQPLAQALQNSCQLAGLKCAQQGFNDLAKRYQQLDR